jgi:hypothetical protein
VKPTDRDCRGKQGYSRIHDQFLRLATPVGAIWTNASSWQSHVPRPVDAARQVGHAMTRRSSTRSPRSTGMLHFFWLRNAIFLSRSAWMLRPSPRESRRMVALDKVVAGWASHSADGFPDCWKTFPRVSGSRIPPHTGSLRRSRALTGSLLALVRANHLH